MTALLAVLAGGALASWLLTRAIRGYALARSVLDVPNQRSSHTVPTPRGGGLAIVAVVLAGTVLACAAGALSAAQALALGGGGAMVAAVGWLDDHRHVPVAWRFAVHIAAAVWAVAWLGGMPQLELGALRLGLGAGGALLAVGALVWLTNLYNFMDGIDGIAGGEALAVGGVGGALLWMAGERGLAAVALAAAAAAAGFLVWNWQPARIFMGDVGSGFLGFLFGALAVASERAGGPPALVWILLLGVFVVDATLTLFRRAARGERLHEAHRRHAYQRAVQSGLSHARVAAAVLLLDALLAALGAAAWLRPAWAPACFAAGAALLLLAYAAVERRRPMSA
ncbi:MAG: glycosyltransferase family 4 protein [Longimicrobiaceae bacterium]